MGRKLPAGEKKETLTITINPELFKTILEPKSNMSKYIEKLIYQDLLSKKLIDENFEL